MNREALLIQAMLCLASYLIGAIPFGLLLGKLKGVDVRTLGSGNIGATNVFRCVSKPLGVATFVLDFLKGLVPAIIFPIIGKQYAPGFQSLENQSALWCGAAAIAGHNWPIYIRFRGGKGISTSAGVLLGVAPAAVGIGALTWLILFLALRFVSLASIGAALAVPAAAWWLYRDQGMLKPMVLTALGMIAVWRHRSNIRRLLDGTEHRFSFSKSKPGSEGTGDH